MENFPHMLQEMMVMTSLYWDYEMAELCTDSTSDPVSQP